MKKFILFNALFFIGLIILTVYFMEVWWLWIIHTYLWGMMDGYYTYKLKINWKQWIIIASILAIAYSLALWAFY